MQEKRPVAASFSKVSRWDDRLAKEQQQGGGERERAEAEPAGG